MVGTATVDEIAGCVFAAPADESIEEVVVWADSESVEVVDEVVVDDGTVVPVAVRPGVPSTSRPLASDPESLPARVVGRIRRVDSVVELLEPSRFIATNTVMLIAKSPSTTTRASAFIGSCVAKSPLLLARGRYRPKSRDTSQGGASV